MEHLYTINDLSIDRIDEICEDVKYQYENGIASCALFMMQLAPQGNPVWDLAGQLCDTYMKFKERLKPYNIPTGILVQSVLGHGHPLVFAPFQRYVNFDNGESPNVYCPYDDDFCLYIKDCMAKIAACHPDVIMIDDDVRMMMWRAGIKGSVNACYCPLHKAEFTKRTGVEINREELYDHVMTHDKDDPYTKALREIQHDSLIKIVRSMREGIDSVDPSIQGANCTTGYVCESMKEMAHIFAGKGNSPIVRVPNGTYAPTTNKDLGSTMFRMAVCREKLREDGIDIILAETDTVPYNRYAKSARYLHAHLTASVFDGAKGAKHWISRFGASEPKSGKAYRKILAEHAGFYDRLSELSAELTPVGCCVPFVTQYELDFRPDKNNLNCAWATKVFERMGLPFYFSNKFTGALFLNETLISQMTDAQIEKMFDCSSVFLDSPSAGQLIERGFERFVGVSVTPYEGKTVFGEVFESSGNKCARQYGLKELRITAEGVKTLSYCYHKTESGFERVCPAVTVSPREDGKITVVYCGTPDTPWNYIDAFSFLNESRKEQFVELLKGIDALPVYYAGDNEICLRAGVTSGGTLVAMFINIGTDPEETLTIGLSKEAKDISMLLPDGSMAKCEWRHCAEGIEVMTAAESMYPVVLIITNQ